MASVYDYDDFDDLADQDDRLGDVEDYRWDPKGKRYRKSVKKRRREDDRPDVDAAQPRVRARVATPSLPMPEGSAPGEPGRPALPGGASGPSDSATAGSSGAPGAPGAPGASGASGEPEGLATLSFAQFEHFGADNEAPIYGTHPEDEVYGFMYELPGARVRGPVRDKQTKHDALSSCLPERTGARQRICTANQPLGGRHCRTPSQAC